MVPEIVVVGGGASIKPYLSVLQPLLATKMVIATNYAYKHFPCTILTFIDRDFYCPAYAKRDNNNPYIYEELKQLPLIIGLEKNDGIKEFLLPNTYIIKCPKKEISHPHLTGLFALCIAEALEPKTIYLLGLDWSKQPIPENKNKYNPYSDSNTHYYNNIKHRGINYTGYYDRHNPDTSFKFFNNSKSKIYNVSLQSNINSFEKISYEQMFELLSNEKINQEEVRQEVRRILCI
jgi:hypothetical protein